MQPERPSRTALRVAMRRAAHQILDRPLVLDDPVALRIVGEERAAEIAADPRAFNRWPARYLRAFLVARSRCAEDALAEAVTRGATQVVILGAGLDTFAYRNPYQPGTLRVFEVDHPATQAWKLERLKRSRIEVPDGVSFVAVDFETQQLPDRLRDSGFRADTPSFFSWLGVTMYLGAETVMSTLRFVASTPRGGGIVFDYAIAPSSLGFIERLVFRVIAARVAALGEPWRTTFEPRALVRDLQALGFAHVDDLHAPEINARYFAHRSDPLRVGRLAGIISARV